MTGSGTIFTSFVKPRLSGQVHVPAEPANGFAAAAAPEPVRPRSHQLLARRIVPVAPGSSAAETVLDVDSGARLEVHLLAAPEVSAQLVAPGSEVVASADPRQGVRVLKADAPAAGAWKVRLTTSGSAPTEALVAGRLVDDGWELDVRAGARRDPARRNGGSRRAKARRGGRHGRSPPARPARRHGAAPRRRRARRRRRRRRLLRGNHGHPGRRRAADHEGRHRRRRAPARDPSPRSPRPPGTVSRRPARAGSAVPARSRSAPPRR